MEEHNGEPRRTEVLGILYVRYHLPLGPMLGDSAFVDALFEHVERLVMEKSPWMECSSTVRKVAESGPDHSRVTFDDNFVPSLTYHGHLK